MRSIQHTSIDEGGGLSGLNADDTAKKLSHVFSRNNLAVRRRGLSADTSLSYEDSSVFVDTSGGNVTITLAAANSWGTYKTPIISVVKTSASNTLTLAAASGDTLSYMRGDVLITGNIAVTGVVVLVSDGSTKWYSLNGDGTNGLSSSYTPTLTNVANLSGTPSAVTLQYFVVGNKVHVFGQVTAATITAATTLTRMRVSLPIASALTNAYELVGGGGTDNFDPTLIKGDTANDAAEVRWYPGSTTASSKVVYIYFSYLLK